MTLLEILEALNDYLTTRDRKYKERRWDLANHAMSWFGKVDFDTWAALYNGSISLLWQQQDDFKSCQKKIRETLIEKSLALFDQAPLSGGHNTAWILNNASRGMYAPYKHVEAFLAGQRPCFVYIFNQANPECVADLQRMGHTVRHMVGLASETTAQIRAWCEMDKIGTLIAETYTAVPLALFAMRTAPVQFYLSPGFQMFPADCVLVPETQDVMAPNAEIVPSPMRKEGLFRAAPREAREFPLIFGCLSRFEKMSIPYLEAVGKILDAAGGHFLAYGRGTLPDIHPRIRNMGFKDPVTALGSMDVYLDTFPLCGGVSVWEAMAAQVPVITLQAESVKSWNRFKPCVKTTEAEYIDAAIEASKNGPLRQHIIEEGLAQARKFVDVERAGRKLDEIIAKWHLQPIAN